MPLRLHTAVHFCSITWRVYRAALCRMLGSCCTSFSMPVKSAPCFLPEHDIMHAYISVLAVFEPLCTTTSISLHWIDLSLFANPCLLLLKDGFPAKLTLGRHGMSSPHLQKRIRKINKTRVIFGRIRYLLSGIYCQAELSNTCMCRAVVTAQGSRSRHRF